jgi:hypothetical protein
MNIIAKTNNEKDIKKYLEEHDDIPIYCKKVIINDYLPFSIENGIVIPTKKEDICGVPAVLFHYVYGQFSYSSMPIQSLNDIPASEFISNAVARKHAIIYMRVFQYLAKHGYRKYFRTYANQSDKCPILLNYILDHYVELKKKIGYA